MFKQGTSTTTTISALTRQRGSTLATFYTGIGDAIIHGPILRELARQLGTRLLLPESPGLELLRTIPELRTVPTVPSTYRNLYILNAEEAVKALANAGVTSILNFRRDRTVNMHRYEHFISVLRSHRIQHFDTCDGLSITEQLGQHTTQLAMQFASRLGLTCIAEGPGWLRPYVSNGEPRNDLIGFFLGASVAIKRLSVFFWAETISMVSRDLAVQPMLIAGAKVEEIQLAGELSTELKRLGVAHVMAPPRNLLDLASLIATLRALVTPDTFALPLAEAVNTPVIGVFCATDPRVYGTQYSSNMVVFSQYYSRCPSRNMVGNCDGWGQGCSHLKCQSHLEPISVRAALQYVLAEGGCH